MLKIGGTIGFWLLKNCSKKPVADAAGHTGAHEPSGGAAKLERFFGGDVWKTFAGRTVVDYGCGSGHETVAAALGGAKRVYGVDVRDRLLASARDLAAAENVADKCVFLNAATQSNEIQSLRGQVDVIYSLDCFEHYPDPEAILRHAFDLLAPGGSFLISFGPPWKHPYGAHMSYFCPLPWVQLVFSEEAVLSVRGLYRHDGAKRYEEVDGGLNCMTVSRFDRLVREGRFEVAKLRPVAVRGWVWLVQNRTLREYFTSVIQCVLTKPLPMGRPEPTSD